MVRVPVGTRRAPKGRAREGLQLLNRERCRMCLGVPGRVMEVRGQVAVVDFWGVKRETRLDVVDEPVEVGDWILNHVGYAIRKIPAEEVAETLSLYELLLKEADSDIMAADVRGEIEATAARPAPDAVIAGSTPA